MVTLVVVFAASQLFVKQPEWSGPRRAPLGWWWADPAGGLVIVYYALREAYTIFADHA